MSEIHSGAVHAAVTVGLCAWRHDSFGQHLRCDDRAIPGGDECADHLIERVHVVVFPATPWHRWFTEEPA